MFGNQLSNLERKSKKAINVFQSTVASLTKVNDLASKEISVKKQKVSEINYEIEELDKIKDTNKKIIDKIQGFLLD